MADPVLEPALIRSKFYLLDPSLRSLGGHPFEYALHVLRAAEARGLTPVLATHAEFVAPDELAAHCSVHPIFPSPAAVDPRFLPRASLADRYRRRAPWLLALRESSRAPGHVGRARRMGREFVDALRRLLRACPPETGDHVFLATATGAFLGPLLDLLAEDAAASRPTWYVQFHNNLYLGREPDYPRQRSRTRRLERDLARARRELRKRRLRLFVTTEQLRIQYAHAGAHEVETLPYPINPDFHTRGAHRPERSPLRVTFVGDARLEKGFQHLPAIVDTVWSSHVETGRVRFVLQANPGFSLPASRTNRCVVRSWTQLEGRDPARVQLLKEPLTSADYRELVLSTDVGLLPYDPERYYSRCSGVLVELLSSGTPLIVPAGCWLSEQIAEPNFLHAERMREKLEALGRASASQVPPELELGAKGAALRLEVPPTATHLFVRFRWRHPVAPGTYVRLTSTPPGGTPGAAPPSLVLGHREHDGEIIAPIAVRGRPGSWELHFRNAFDTEPIALDALRVERSRAVEEDDPPLGAVGLIAASPAEMGGLLGHLIDHFPHFAATAAEFAQGWTRWHHPRRVVEELLRAPEHP